LMRPRPRRPLCSSASLPFVHLPAPVHNSPRAQRLRRRRHLCATPSARYKHQGGLCREHDIKTLWKTNIDSEKGLMSTLFFLHQHSCWKPKEFMIKCISYEFKLSYLPIKFLGHSFCAEK
jgi:hypothetical protein